MTRRSNPAAELDEEFVQIFLDELSGIHAKAAADIEDDEGLDMETLTGTHTDNHTHADSAAPIPLEPADDAPRAGLRSQEPPPAPPAPAPEPPPDETGPSEAASPPPARAPAGPRRWQLRLMQPDKPECLLPLDSDGDITIGREADNALTVPSPKVSRHHARIWLEPSGPRVKDLGSRNGTLVNGTKLPAALLQPNDVVTIGPVRIRVEAVAVDGGAGP